jgi:RNA polymerase sigma-70 factor (ECF subfamily)
MPSSAVYRSCRCADVYFCVYFILLRIGEWACLQKVWTLLNRAVSLLGGQYRPGPAGITGGEADADITVLYQTYRAPLMSFALRLTGGDRQQAEDVVQETMVRAWREAGRLDRSGPSLMPWLTAVARRIVIDEHRRRRARPPETGEAAVTDLPVDDDTTATVLRVAVADAMRQLTSSHRQILHETILRDQTVGKAAEALGIPVGTAKSRVYYALRVLEVVLAERGLGP